MLDFIASVLSTVFIVLLTLLAILLLLAYFSPETLIELKCNAITDDALSSQICQINAKL